MKRGSEWRPILVLLAKPLALVAALWLLLAGLDAALPYIRPGAEVVYAAKSESIGRGGLFRPGAPVRVAVFGNSKVLTSFQPELFDALAGGQVSSYNLGLPNYLLFIENLERLCQQGERPTHVLLMFPWPDTPARSFDPFHPGVDDDKVMDALFPFRKLPRNLSLFAARSRSRGGMAAFYRESRRQTEAMLAQRGYYFIEGQSHFPGHRLPDDFRLQKDDPGVPFSRVASTAAPTFSRLRELAERYDIRVLFVPAYHREGECAPPPEPSPLVAALAGHPRFEVVGPDYWLLPRREFSDPVHLNPGGAALYTRRLWELVGPQLTGYPPMDSARALSAPR